MLGGAEIELLTASAFAYARDELVVMRYSFVRQMLSNVDSIFRAKP